MRNSHRKHLVLSILAAAVIAGAGAVWAAASNDSNSSVSAQSQIAALSTKAVAVSNTALPAIISSARSDLGSSEGAAHLLLSKNGVGQYAWTHGSEICHSDTNGNGGCFGSFPPSGVDWIIADPDGLGSGAPMYINGPVSDDVTAVSVVVDGAAYPATVSNNAMYYQLPSGTLGRSAIQSLVITHADGTKDTIDLTAPDPLSSIKTSTS
jgi:hypothetical protein